MRPELELMEKIEQYLKGEMTDPGKASFESQIANDPALAEQVKLQADIMRGIERNILKQKIQIAGKRFRWGVNARKWGLGGLSVAVILSVVFFYDKNASHHYAYEGKSLPEYNEQGEKKWADADRNIPAQIFLLNASKDTVIETKGGIVMAVPAHVFLDENGNPVDGRIELAVKEALDPATIMKAGLSTRSGNNLLESGGMFFTDARKDGKILKIDPAHGIYAEIPTDNNRPGMQLFNGKRTMSGNIDWINPKPLEHDLVPVDIQMLNFYPPHYLDSLQQWGYDRMNKKFTDSLYYSLARLFANETEYIGPASKPIMENEKSSGKMSKSEFLDKLLKNGSSQPRKYYSTDTITSSADSSISETCYGINPSKIKAIWNEKFQNTILATREFEERLYWIHVYRDPAIFDLYVNNLDKSLSVIDSLAALIWHGGSDVYKIFSSFASRHDGKVQNGSKQFEMLREYYQNKARAFTEAIAKTENEFWGKQAQLDDEALDRRTKHETDSINRMAQNFREELRLNIKEAYRQLGYDTAIVPRPGTSAYRAQVTTTGWCNVDRYVTESTITRTSLNYTEPGTGKKAIINYLPVSVQVDQWKQYDRLNVYLLPDRLTSFMRLDGIEGKYTEKLDELMRYKLICIAYKDEQAYFYSKDTIEAKDYSTIILTPAGKDELNKKLNSAGNFTQSSFLDRENDFALFDITDQKRQKYNLGLQELTRRATELIFPCYSRQQPITNTEQRK
ncbi:MAG: hypothetical protein Q8941_11865 [Bacteroidota bacterium]|nr:hypothetical protein [Bacteroidota bacterium]